jgi:GAF domain-containing protein
MSTSTTAKASASKGNCCHNITWVSVRPGRGRASSGGSVHVPDPPLENSVEQAGMSLVEHAARSLTEPEARLRFLMEAGTQLDGSLDLMTTLQTLAVILVPQLGDVCLIDLIGPDDRAERRVIRHVDRELENRLWSLTRRWPSAFDSSGAIRETIRSGRAQFTPRVSTESLERAFSDPEQRALILSMEYRSAIIVPLAAHGRTLGAITLCLVGPDGPLYTERDVALLEDLARRASLAVDNSGLYTELRRADDAQRFLSETSRALAGSLDWDTTLRTIAGQVVAGIADACSIDVVDVRGRPQLAVVEHIDPVKRELCLETSRRYPVLLRHGQIRQMMATRQSVLYPRLADADLVALSVDEDHLRLLREIGLSSALWVPMVSRDRVIGTIGLGITESDRRLGPADLALAEELGRRAGVAADNARLYSDRARVAQTLQRSLMPTRLPAVPYLDTAVRFRFAGDGTELGGDFYDLFEHRPGCWTAVVGDVCGKGAAAAAITALARHTIRAAARYEDGPIGVLRALHLAVTEQSPKFMFCTAAVVECRPAPAACALRVALGGHPPALVLRADGRLDPVGPPGPLLGVLDEVQFTETPVLLAVGDALVLYTDGVIEAGAPDAQLGEEWLAATLTTLAGQDAHTIAGEITRRVLDVEGDMPSDDIAVLVLRSA